MNQLILNQIEFVCQAAAEDRTLSRIGLRAAIEGALRIQDRETRHACAEAVAALAVTRELELFVPLITANQVIMNAQAI